MLTAGSPILVPNNPRLVAVRRSGQAGGRCPRRARSLIGNRPVAVIGVLDAPGAVRPALGTRWLHLLRRRSALQVTGTMMGGARQRWRTLWVRVDRKVAIVTGGASG